MNDTTTRTASPETTLRNLRNRIAQLTLKRVMGTITDADRQELRELERKLHNIERGKL